MITVDEIWTQATYDVLNRGSWVKSRIQDSIETIGWCQELDTLNHTFLVNRRRKLSLQYASAELLWYLSGVKSVEMIAAYAPQYVNFADNGEAWGAYGWRWGNDSAYIEQGGNTNQLCTAIDLLRKSSADRRCVVTMWNAGDLVHAANKPKNDLPCTLSWQFLLRENKLHMICTMRSEDLWLGMPYDIYVNTCIQQLIASALKVESGTYIHQVGSLHVYEKDLVKVREANLHCDSGPAHNWPEYTMQDFDLNTRTAIALEKVARTHVFAFPNYPFQIHPVLSDAVNLCASKWMTIESGLIQSKLLKEIYDARG